MTHDGASGLTHHPVVSHEEWLAARTAFLAREKEFTRLRDQLSEERRRLPWEAVTKAYVFEGPSGKRTLAELFEGRSQLVVYHAMFDPRNPRRPRPGPATPRARPARSGPTTSTGTSSI